MAGAASNRMEGSSPEVDALLPAKIAAKAEEAGAQKGRLDWLSLTALSVLAGAFIGLGAMFSTTVLAGAQDTVPYGLARLAAGVTFCLGLILVVLAGAELFTGDALMVMAVASGRLSLAAMLRAWAIIYAGNLVGAVATALLVFLSGQPLAGHGTVAKAALAIAAAKTTLPFGRAVILGVLCNVLVCAAVWLSLGARTAGDKLLAVLFPITAFVAAGFEHSVANMYFIPLGVMIRDWSGPEFWTLIGSTPAKFASVTWGGLLGNLVPVTVGNVIGGGLLVGGVYWLIYLRPRRHPAEP